MGLTTGGNKTAFGVPPMKVVGPWAFIELPSFDHSVAQATPDATI